MDFLPAARKDGKFRRQQRFYHGNRHVAAS